MEEKLYVIKTLRMVEYLSSLGINMVRIAKDNRNPKYNVFLYKDTEELRHALDKKEKFKA